METQLLYSLCPFHGDYGRYVILKYYEALLHFLSDYHVTVCYPTWHPALVGEYVMNSIRDIRHSPYKNSFFKFL